MGGAEREWRSAVALRLATGVGVVSHPTKRPIGMLKELLFKENCVQEAQGVGCSDQGSAAQTPSSWCSSGWERRQHSLQLPAPSGIGSAAEFPGHSHPTADQYGSMRAWASAQLTASLYYAFLPLPLIPGVSTGCCCFSCIFCSCH